MESIFNSDNPWLEDFRSDEQFVSALKMASVDIHDFDWPDAPKPRAIPVDPRNIFTLKVRFADMVRGCSLPGSLAEIEAQLYEVDSFTMERFVYLRAHLDDADEIGVVLFHLAFLVFMHGYKFWKYNFFFDNQKFSQLLEALRERQEREALESADESKNVIVLDDSIGQQNFDWWWHIRFDLENSHACNRQSECHHHEHDEHWASEHTYNFMIRAFGNIENIWDYVIQERSVLLQIKNNQTKWVKKVLRYSLLYIQEIRRITNEHLGIKIPDEVNSDLFSELQSKDWFIDPRTFIRW